MHRPGGKSVAVCNTRDYAGCKQYCNKGSASWWHDGANQCNAQEGMPIEVHLDEMFLAAYVTLSAVSCGTRWVACIATLANML